MWWHEPPAASVVQTRELDPIVFAASLDVLWYCDLTPPTPKALPPADAAEGVDTGVAEAVLRAKRAPVGGKQAAQAAKGIEQMA